MSSHILLGNRVPKGQDPRRMDMGSIA